MLCEALERKQPMHISCKRVAREGGCVGRVAGYAACAPLVSSVGRRQRNRRGCEQRRGEERDGIDMGCVCTAVLRALVGRLAGSLHLRTLRPSLQGRRRRRCICSCDLDACLPCCCSPRSSVLLSSRKTSYTGAPSAYPYATQIRSPSPSPSPSPSKLPLLQVCRTRLYRALIPSASVGRLSHQPPATARRLLTLFARFPEPGRRCLNLISARRSAPQETQKLASTLYRQSLQEPAYRSAPATLLPPKRPRGSNLTARLFVGRTHMT
jgi:hypothetical protein